jgi:hypothetical protein
MNGSTRKQIQKLKDEEKFPAKEIRIMNLHFLLHLSGLLPPDNATPIMRVLHKIFLTGIFTLNILALSGQMMAVYVHWGDIPLIATIMSHLTGLLLTIIACLYFLYNKNKFMALVELLRMEFVNKMKSKYMGFVVVAERRVKMAALLAAPIATSLAILWVIAPFLNGDESDNFENNNATNGDKNVKGLMFVMWTPFDIQESPRFEIIIALQFIVVSLPIIMIFSVDAIFVSLMSHAAAQFKLLCAMLNDMHENIAESEFHRTEERASPMHVSTDNSSVKETLTSARGNIPHEYPSGSEEHSGSPSSEIARPGDDHVDEDPIRLYLVECIKYHVAIIEYVTTFHYFKRILKTYNPDTKIDNPFFFSAGFKTAVPLDSEEILLLIRQVAPKHWLT